METQCLPVSLAVWITAVAGVLDARQQARFVQVTSWLRGCGVRGDYKRYLYLLGSVGRKTLPIAAALLRIPMKRLPGDGPSTPLVFAIHDSPTKRYGPHIEGPGKHHNPTPGPAGPKFLERRSQPTALYGSRRDRIRPVAHKSLIAQSRQRGIRGRQTRRPRTTIPICSSLLRPSGTRGGNSCCA